MATTTNTVPPLKEFVSQFGTKINGSLAFLVAGGEFSVAEAKRAGIRRPDDMVYRLRQEGEQIYTNTRRDSAGNKIKRYRAAV